MPSASIAAINIGVGLHGVRCRRNVTKIKIDWHFHLSQWTQFTYLTKWRWTDETVFDICIDRPIALRSRWIRWIIDAIMKMQLKLDTKSVHTNSGEDGIIQSGECRPNVDDAMHTMMAMTKHELSQLLENVCASSMQRPSVSTANPQKISNSKLHRMREIGYAQH